MILKILLVILVIAIVYFMFIKKKPIRTTKGTKHNEQENKKLDSNDMVACTTCGIYAELDDTIISNNKYYCSTECVGKA